MPVAINQQDANEQHYEVQNGSDIYLEYQYYLLYYVLEIDLEQTLGIWRTNFILRKCMAPKQKNQNWQLRTNNELPHARVNCETSNVLSRYEKIFLSACFTRALRKKTLLLPDSHRIKGQLFYAKYYGK